MAKQNGGGSGSGNGSGSGSGSSDNVTPADGGIDTLEALRARAGDAPQLEVSDLVEVSVLSMFMVQKLGKASLSEVRSRLEAIGASVNEHVLQNALEALRGRQLLSYATGRRAKGDVEKMYVTRKVVFAGSLEVAHVSDLLPRLVATPEAKSLIDELNGAEADGDGDEKKTRKLGYQDYVEVRATFLTLDELVGSQPASPYLDDLVERSCKLTGLPKVEAGLRFWRDHTTGKIKIPSDAIRGWMRTGLRSAGISEAAAGYPAVSDALLDVACDQLKQVALPILDPQTRRGLGLATCEILPPKQRLVVHFRLPTRGLMTPRQFKLWLAAYAPNPIRGCSPARGARFGKMVLIKFEELGATANATASLGAVMDLVPDEAREFYRAMLAESAGVDLRKGRDGAVDEN